MSHFDLPGLKEELIKIEAVRSDPDFYKDLGRAQRVNQRAKIVESTISGYQDLLARFTDHLDFTELVEMEDDPSLETELNSAYKELAEEIEILHLSTLLKGEYDSRNAMLTLHAGAGGTEAQDWTQMLFRMYSMYADKHKYELKVLDMIDGDEAGIKSVTFTISGINAYGYLKAEKGVHRLVRISPFDSNARRHTSFASLEVMPEINDETEIKINPEDLKIDTYRSGGAGGQHVNKTESAIRILHIPTGIVVQCQNERSQVQNRETAMSMLRSKLTELREQENMDKAQSIKGEIKKIEWGSQIRSYVFQPYTMVKDHRTGYESGNISAVMDGDLDGFIFDYLRKS